VQLAGGISVPLFHKYNYQKIIDIANLCDADVIIVHYTINKNELNLISKFAKKNNKTVIVTNNYNPKSLKRKFIYPNKESISFLQYTSGSTGEPKGVQITNQNLIKNIQQMIDGMEITNKDIFVSWLPVYHDMGLILMTMVPFFLGIKLVLLPMDNTSPIKWIRAIHDWKATFIASPDFAYRLCILYVKDGYKYDLSSLRVALNAAEPVRSGTIKRFEKKFNLKNVMTPAYGLAEATVGVSCWKPQTSIKIDDNNCVSVGYPFDEINIKILKSGKLAKNNELGEIIINSPCNTVSYYNNNAATNELKWKNNFIKTGDIGYIDNEGHLYIVGRKKNIIIQAGRNISSREIEEIVDKQTFIRFSAAVGIDKGTIEGELAYVFAELRPSVKPNEYDEILEKIIQSLIMDISCNPRMVLLLKPRSIPKTNNGKIQYDKLKNQFLSKELRDNRSILYPHNESFLEYYCNKD